MEKRFLYTFFGIVLFVSLDFFVGICLSSLLERVPNAGTRDSNVKYTICNAEADVLIVGSSAASHHYIPKMMSDSLGLSVYNTGRDAFDIYYSNAVLNIAIKRHRPQVVILDVRKNMFDGKWKEHLLDCNCFYNLSEPLANQIDKVSSWQDKVKMMSNCYRFNKSLSWMSYAFLKGDKRSDGYIPYFETRSDLKHEVLTTNKTFSIPDDYKLEFEDFVRTCKNENISLFVFYSPSLVEVQDGFVSEIRNFCNRFNVPFYDYESRSEFNEHPELFVDVVHLNKDGAEKFTRIVLELIKR